MSRRRGFSDAQVVDIALALLDEGGRDALSIRSVAARLGVNPNAVYTYVASRAELERTVTERVVGGVDVGVLGSAGIVAFAHDVRDRLLEHPAVAQVLMTAPMDGPAARAIGEALLAAFAETGQSVQDSARAAYALMVHVIGSVALEVAETDGRPPLAPEAERVADRRKALGYIDTEQWPRTAAAAETMAQWISREQFDWSVRRLLDGLTAGSLRPVAAN